MKQKSIRFDIFKWLLIGEKEDEYKKCDSQLAVAFSGDNAQ